MTIKNKFKISLAFLVAAWCHRGQVRKWSSTPYITHPVMVFRILKDAEKVEDETYIAALLHDTLEDTDISEKLIVRLFGPRVLKIVMEVSNIYDTQNPDFTRHEKGLSAVKYFCRGSVESRKLKLADRLHNLPSVIKNDPKRAKKYIIESEHLLECCADVDKVLASRLDKIITEYHLT